MPAAQLFANLIIPNFVFEKILKKLNKSEFLFTILISLLIDIFRFNIQNKYELQFQNIWKQFILIRKTKNDK